METTVTTSLSGLLHRPSGVSLQDALVDDAELVRRHLLSREMIRYVVTTITQINVLANVLATLHINYLLSRAGGGVVPNHVGTQAYFVWTFACCSTYKGSHTLPTMRCKFIKNAEGEKENAPEGPVEQDKRRTLETLTRVFEQVFRPMLPSHFKFPARDGLSADLDGEARKRQTGFRNMCFTTLFGRQQKVLRWQIGKLVREFFPQSSEYPLLSAKAYTSNVNAITNGAVKIACNEINGWNREKDHMADLESLFTPSKQKVHFLPSDDKRAEFQQHLECILIEHRYFIETDSTGAMRSMDAYGVTEKLIEKNAASFLPYLAYLYGEYMEHNAELTKDAWKSFAPIPQLSLHLAFIDITARGLCKWAAMSKTAIWKHHLQSLEECPEESHDAIGSIELDWICPDATGNVASWADAHKSLVLNRFFKLDSFMMDKLSNQRKVCTPTYTVSTDGQQAKIHIHTVRLNEDGSPKDVSAPKSAKSRKRKRSSDDCDVNAEHALPLPTTTTDREATYVVSEAEFTNWADEGRTIISVDPGRVSLISAVRHLPQSHHSVYDDLCAERIDRLQDDAFRRSQSPRSSNNRLPTTSVTTKKRISKTRRSVLKQMKLAEKHQSLYELSNKQYYEMCGFTSARKQRQEARGTSGLQQMDLEMSAYTRRSFDNNHYYHWASILLQSKWWNLLWQEVTRPWYRKLRFHCYQSQQRAFSQIASQLCSGDGITRRPDECIILWGNGGFAATGKGHAAAPNIGLRTALRRHGLRIYLVDEFRSSMLSSCCHVPLTLCYGSKNHYRHGANSNVLLNPRQEIRSVRVCKCHNNSIEEREQEDSDACVKSARHSTLWGRDVSAAINIYEICKRRALDPATHFASAFSRTL